MSEFTPSPRPIHHADPNSEFDAAEADRAALECQAAEMDAAITEYQNDPVAQRGADEWTAWNELVNVAQKYGFDAARKVVQDAMAEIVHRGIKPELPNIPIPRPITRKVRKLDLSKYGHEGTGWSA
jgi:hypothetical protein